MNARPLLVSGWLAPLVYVATVILGAELRPGYSHLAHAISELTEAGAPNQLLLDVLFAVFGLLCASAGFGLLTVVRRTRIRTLTVASAVLLGLGVLSACFGFFPMDPRTAPSTVTGAIHLALAGLSSLATMVAIGLWAFGADRQGWRRHAGYSWVTLAWIFVTGGMAAASAACGHPLMGLAERLTIGGYLQWLFVTSWLACSGRFASDGRAENREPA
jgi:hypothetical membrane protein